MTHHPFPVVHWPDRGPSAGYRLECDTCPWHGPWRDTEDDARADWSDHPETPTPETEPTP